MYVVTVQFDIAPPFATAFLAAIRANACYSRRIEPGCRQFDVCVPREDASRVFLYEVYDDEEAFRAHVASEHFRQFDAAVKAWVNDKTVQLYRRAYPDPSLDSAPAGDQ
jgi:quinol monooxygenase YgiN